MRGEDPHPPATKTGWIWFECTAFLQPRSLVALRIIYCPALAQAVVYRRQTASNTVGLISISVVLEGGPWQLCGHLSKKKSPAWLLALRQRPFYTHVHMLPCMPHPVLRPLPPPGKCAAPLLLLFRLVCQYTCLRRCPHAYPLPLRCCHSPCTQTQQKNQIAAAAFFPAPSSVAFFGGGGGGGLGLSG